MSYSEKVSGACRQDEDLLGEKFRYNKEDDIVLLFSGEDMKTAYCYKKKDLRRLIKSGHKRNGHNFRYLIVPHTGQYIVNPETILESDKHVFRLIIADRSLYRDDYYPETLYDAETIILPEFQIFENAPEIGVETKEETQPEFRPSEEYLEREERMRELRERRREEGKEIKDVEHILSRSPNDWDHYMEYKQLYLDEEEKYNELITHYMANLNTIKFEGIQRYNPVEVKSREEAGRTRGYSIWVDSEGSVRWFKDGKLNRSEDLPAGIINIEGVTLFAWYKDGKLHRTGNEPAKIYTNGIIQYYWNGRQIARPSSVFQIDFNTKSMIISADFKVYFKENNIVDNEVQNYFVNGVEIVGYFEKYENTELTEIIYIPKIRP